MKQHSYLILWTAVVALPVVYGMERSKPPGGIAGTAKVRDADPPRESGTTQEPEPKPIFLPPGGGRIISGLEDGGQITFKLGGGESGSTFGFAEGKNPPSGGPPEHIHLDADEAFYVLSGNFRVKVGDQVEDVGPGSFVFAPRGIPHAFVNTGTTEGTLLTVDSPPKFEACMREITDALRRMPPGHPDQKILDAISDKCKTKIVGPPLGGGVQREPPGKP